MKQKIFFLHLPKCAGSSIHSLIAKSLFVSHKRIWVATQKDVDNLEKLTLDELLTYRVVGGHINYPYVRSRFPTEEWSAFYRFTILRDPLKRAISLYHYILRSPEHHQYQKVKEITFEEFILGGLYDGNLQCRMIAGKADWQEAFDILRNEFDVFGTTEQLRMIVEKICKDFQVPLPLELPRVNVTKYSPDFDYDLDKKVMDRLRELDEQDQILYEKVRAMILVSETTISYFQTANQLKQKGQLSEALAYYDQAIEQNPKFHWYHHSLGETMAKLGRFEEAIASFQQAIDISPNGSSYYGMAQSYTQLGNIDRANLAYYRAIELNPNWGVVLVKQGGLDRVIACFDSVLQREPHQAMVYYDFSRYLAERDLMDDAIALFQKSPQFSHNQELNCIDDPIPYLDA